MSCEKIPYDYPEKFIDFKSKNTKYYDDHGPLRTLILPPTFSATISVQNIVSYVSLKHKGFMGVKNVMKLLSEYQNLFKHYTKMRVKYDVDINLEFISTLSQMDIVKVPEILNTKFEFKYNGPSFVSFSQMISYMFCRFMLPSSPLKPIKATEELKNTYFELYDNTLKAWEKIICDSIKQKYKQPSKQLEEKLNEIQSKRKNICRILFSIFHLVQDTSAPAYKFACAVLFFNPCQIISEYVPEVNPELFDLLKIEENTDEKFKDALSFLETTEKPVQKLAHKLLQNVFRFKHDRSYTLPTFDEECRSLLLSYISENFIEDIRKGKFEEEVSVICNRITTPSITTPLGLTQNAVLEFEKFDRIRFLEFIFSNYIQQYNLQGNIVGNFFPLINKYYHQDKQYQNILFNKWETISDENICALLEWCFFIQDKKYTILFLSRIAFLQTDAKTFICKHSENLTNHSIMILMKDGLVLKGSKIAPKLSEKNQHTEPIKIFIRNIVKEELDNKTVNYQTSQIIELIDLF